jgi:hypothetical protein
LLEFFPYQLFLFSKYFSCLTSILETLLKDIYWVALLLDSVGSLFYLTNINCHYSSQVTVVTVYTISELRASHK